MFYNEFLNSKWAVFCLLTLVVFAVFGRTIWFDYVQLDEGILLINNKFFISEISNFFEVFKHDINYPTAVAPYYRPIFILSFMLNSQFGSSTIAYHVGNILLHISAVIMLFWLLRELDVKKTMSLLFSILFAVHPAVTPIVAWVPGRIEAILAIFTLFSFILFIRFLNTARWYYLVSFFLSFTIAIFTKEVAIALLPILLFYYLMHKNEKGSEMLVTLFSGLTAIIIAWFLLRKSIIAPQITDMSFFSMLSVIWHNLEAIILYLGKILLPFNLTVLPVLENSPLFYGFGALAILILFWFLSKVKIISLSSLGILWFIVFLVPSLASYNSSEKMVFFEHRSYLPLIGIIIFFASLRGQVPFLQQKRYLTPLLAGIIVLFSILAFNYSSFYKDKMSFWQKAVADSPGSSDAHNGLATAYLMDGKLKEAEAEFIRTTEINPKSFVAYHRLGRIYAQSKNLKEAEKYFLESLEINPDYVLTHQDLAVLYFFQNKHPQAIVHIKELLRLQTAETLHPQILKIIEIYAKETALQRGL